MRAGVVVVVLVVVVGRLVVSAPGVTPLPQGEWAPTLLIKLFGRSFNCDEALAEGTNRALVRGFAGLVARIGAGLRRSRRSRFATPDDRLVPPRRLHLSVRPSAQTGGPPPLHCTCARSCHDRPSPSCSDGTD